MRPATWRAICGRLASSCTKLLLRQLPFRGKTAFETSSAILHEMPPPLPARIPPSLWATIQRCLAKDPAQRYQGAGEVKAALDAVESAAIAGAQPPSQPSGFQTMVMRGVRHLTVSDRDVLLLVGTTKGAFLLRSTSRRSRWEVAGPTFMGTRCTLWPMRAGADVIDSGRRRAISGAPFSAPATTSVAPGQRRSKQT